VALAPSISAAAHGRAARVRRRRDGDRGCWVGVEERGKGAKGLCRGRGQVVVERPRARRCFGTKADTRLGHNGEFGPTSKRPTKNGKIKDYSAVNPFILEELKIYLIN